MSVGEPALGWDGVILRKMLFVEQEANVSKVSIVMPAYNAERYITEAIQSVIAQTFTDWELIVIDDASQDNTAEIVQKLLIQDTRILFLQNLQNSGVATTRNRGLDIATGEYIAFLDSDDFWESNKLQRQLDLLRQTSADLCFTAYALANEKGQTALIHKVPRSVSYRDLLKENVVGCSTVLVRRGMLTKFRFETNYFHEDYVLWLQLLKNGCTTVGLNDVLAHYRTGGRSSDKINAAKSRWNIYRKHEQLPLHVAGFNFFVYCCNGLNKHVRAKVNK